jgi:hypothetical protein
MIIGLKRREPVFRFCIHFRLVGSDLHQDIEYRSLSTHDARMKSEKQKNMEVCCSEEMDAIYGRRLLVKAEE